GRLGRIGVRFLQGQLAEAGRVRLEILGADARPAAGSGKGEDAQGCKLGLHLGDASVFRSRLPDTRTARRVKEVGCVPPIWVWPPCSADFATEATIRCARWSACSPRRTAARATRRSSGGSRLPRARRRLRALASGARSR